MKLNTPLNESAEKHYSVVSETYDLLQALNHPNDPVINQTCQLFKDRFMLFRGSSYAPLREARIRSFKPILKNSYQSDKHVDVEVNVQPYVFDYDPDFRYPMSKSFNDYDLYNSFITSQNISDAQLRVQSESYKVSFNSNTEQLIDDINNVIHQYFNQFDVNGTFDFTNNKTHNYIRNYGEIPQAEDNIGIVHEIAISDLKINGATPIRNGYMLFDLKSITAPDSGAAFIISKPEDLEITDIYVWNHPVYVNIVAAVSPLKDCSTVYFCDDYNMWAIKDGVMSHIIDLTESWLGYEFKFLATNDRNTIAIIYDSLYDKYLYFLVNGYDLVPIIPKLNDVDRTDLVITAISGFNDKFICYVNSANGDVSHSHLELCNREMSEWEVITPSISTGNYDDFKFIDVINKLDEIYVMVARTAYDADRGAVITYRYGKDDDGVYVWTQEWLQYVGKNIYSLSHHGSYFMISTKRLPREKEIYIFPASGGNATLWATIPTDADADPPVYISGSYETARVVISQSNSSTLKFYYSELKPINDDVLTINDYKSLFNFPLNEIPLYKFKIITDPDDPAYSDDPEQPTIYNYDLMVPLTNVLLMFSVSINTSPIALLYTSEYHNVFNNFPIVATTYLNTRNLYSIIYSPTYSEDVKRLEFVNNDYGLTLCSEHMNNISQVVYTGYTEANVVYKRFDCLPSTNYINMYLKDVEGHVPTKNKLNEFYTRIIVEIDYIYESV